MIGNILKLVQSNEYYGGGEYIELAKGKNEYTTSFKGLKRKIKRIWLSSKK